jgi:ABC-2 type transport system ATP-binding protein
VSGPGGDPIGVVIEAEHLTKRYGTTTAVADLSFSVRPGAVTGFLGPNGAGKTTTMRMVVGLDRPTEGRVTIDGRSFDSLPAPLRQVGALIDAGAFHKGRTARNHLLYLAQSNSIPPSRVDEVLRLVGLDSVAKRKVKTFSLGMAQRLGIAAALLGDPDLLLFDEPVNGLDPQGILWVRTFLRALAAEGRTVLVSSHLMTEMAQTADRLIVIGKGRMIADTTTDELVSANSAGTVRVSAAEPIRLADRLRSLGATVQAAHDGTLAVSGPDSRIIGELAAAEGFVLYELTPLRASLEEAFMNLTRASVEYGAAAVGGRTAPVAPNLPSRDVGSGVTGGGGPRAPGAGAPPGETTDSWSSGLPGAGAPPGQTTDRWSSGPSLPPGVRFGSTPPIAFDHIVLAEWTKVRSIRSTAITMVVTVLLVVGIGSLICVAVAQSNGASIGDPTAVSLAMLVIAQLVVGIFGVMTVTSEYASGTIRPTLMAVPRRTVFLLAKLVVVGAVCLVVGEITAFAAFGAGQAILNGHTASASLSEPGVLRAVIGAGLYLTVLGLVGSGVGVLVRVTAGGIAVVVGLVFIAPIILAFIPGRVGADLRRYWPTQAGAQVFRVQSDASAMAPWAGFAVLVGFVAVVLVAAGYLLNRRDA